MCKPSKSARKLENLGALRTLGECIFQTVKNEEKKYKNKEMIFGDW
jgi:hypothetical protein